MRARLDANGFRGYRWVLFDHQGELLHAYKSQEEAIAAACEHLGLIHRIGYVKDA